MSTLTEFSKNAQLDTPKDWILSDKLFRLKTWELSYEDIESAILKHIPKDSFELNVIEDKEGNKKEISCLYIKDQGSVEKIRTNVLETTIGKISKLKKIPQLKNNLIVSKTIKTTAPKWVTKDMIFDSFSEYSSDKKIYKIKENSKFKLIQYPIVRMHPKKVIREGETVDANVIYVQFSPKRESENDCFIALSMKHRSRINDKNNNFCTLLFDEWVKEKKSKKVIYDVIE